MVAEGAVRHPDRDVPSRRFRIVPRRYKPVFQRLNIDELSAVDSKFYREDERLSGLFVESAPARDSYFEGNPCVIITLHCIDEKEQDFEKQMGLPPGVANALPIAGCKIGLGNLNLIGYLKRKIDNAKQAGKMVVLLVVTHESQAQPDTDSCLAWKHNVHRADANAVKLVQKFNTNYVDRDSDNRIVSRHLIAFHIKSKTDTEARVWCGENGISVDPADFSLEPHALLSQLKGKALEHHIYERFKLAFPPDSPRFSAVEPETRVAILEQLARMCANNVLCVREYMSKPHRIVKTGHKGTRVLVGRGWDMYTKVGKYFKVGDYSPDFRKECRMAAMHVAVNGLVNRRNFLLPFHVNILYDETCPGDRSQTIFYAREVAQKIKAHLSRLFKKRKARLAFDREVRGELRSRGVAWRELPLKVRRHYRDELYSSLRIYISVSSRSTRLLELVAII